MIEQIICDSINIKKRRDILWKTGNVLNVNTTYEKDQFQATGGNFAKVFDIQNKKFITITCTKCGYTELYKTGTSAGMNIFDFLVD